MVAEAPEDTPTSEAVATNSQRKPYREKLSSEDYLSLARFRSAIRRFLAFSEAETRSAGITTQQYQAMLAIKTHPRGTMMIKELAEELLLLPNSAVQLIDRLEAAGLAQRRESGSDRRGVSILIEFGSRHDVNRLAGSPGGPGRRENRVHAVRAFREQYPATDRRHDADPDHDGDANGIPSIHASAFLLTRSDDEETPSR